MKNLPFVFFRIKRKLPKKSNLFLIVFLALTPSLYSSNLSCKRFNWLLQKSMDDQGLKLAQIKVRNSFQIWLAPQKIAGKSFRYFESSLEQIPKKVLQQLYQQFEIEMFQEFEKYQGELKKFYLQRLAQDQILLQRSREVYGPRLFSETFRVKDLTTIKSLGSGLEGEVFLSYINNEFMVRKTFTEGSEAAAFHESVFKVLNQPDLMKQLQKKRINVAQVKYKEGAHLVLNFKTGILHNDLLALQRASKLPPTFWDTYAFMHALFLKNLMEIVKDSVSNLEGKSRLFIPHSNNVAYNPLDQSWFIFDVH